MRMSVDEPRRDEPFPGVDRPSRGSEVAPDRHHAVPLDRDVRAMPRRAQPVVNEPSGDHQVVHQPVTLPDARALSPIRRIGRQFGHRFDRIRGLRFGDDHHSVVIG